MGGYGSSARAWYELSLKGARRRQKVPLGHAKEGPHHAEAKWRKFKVMGPCSSVQYRLCSGGEADRQTTTGIGLPGARPSVSPLYLLPPGSFAATARRPQPYRSTLVAIQGDTSPTHQSADERSRPKPKNMCQADPQTISWCWWLLLKISHDQHSTPLRKLEPTPCRQQHSPPS